MGGWGWVGGGFRFRAGLFCHPPRQRNRTRALTTDSERRLAAASRQRRRTADGAACGRRGPRLPLGLARAAAGLPRVQRHPAVVPAVEAQLRSRPREQISVHAPAVPGERSPTDGGNHTSNLPLLV